MKQDCAPVSRMPMYLLMVVALVALFAGVVFYLFLAPGRSKLISQPSRGSSLLVPIQPRSGTRLS